MATIMGVLDPRRPERSEDWSGAKTGAERRLERSEDWSRQRLEPTKTGADKDLPLKFDSNPSVAKVNNNSFIADMDKSSINQRHHQNFPCALESHSALYQLYQTTHAEYYSHSILSVWVHGNEDSTGSLYILS
eukprot:gene16005-7340_t